MTAKECTFKILDSFEPGHRFSGISLMLRVKDETGKIHYPDTMLRYLRRYRQKTGRQVVNVDKARSIYEVRG